MKKVLFLVAIFLSAALSARPAAAAYVTGNDLAAACQSDKPLGVTNCMNYVAGVIDYHVMLQSLGTAPTIDFCLPENLSLEEAAFVVMQYLKRSPQHDPFIAAPAVAMALHEAYPCGEAPAPRKKKKHG